MFSPPQRRRRLFIFVWVVYRNIKSLSSSYSKHPLTKKKWGRRRKKVRAFGSQKKVISFVHTYFISSHLIHHGPPKRWWWKAPRRQPYWKHLSANGVGPPISCRRYCVLTHALTKKSRETWCQYKVNNIKSLKEFLSFLNKDVSITYNRSHVKSLKSIEFHKSSCNNL